MAERRGKRTENRGDLKQQLFGQLLPVGFVRERCGTGDPCKAAFVPAKGICLTINKSAIILFVREAPISLVFFQCLLNIQGRGACSKCSLSYVSFTNSPAGVCKTSSAQKRHLDSPGCWSQVH